MRFHSVVAFILACLAMPAAAQAPGVPIERSEAATGSREVLDKAGSLREAGKLINAERIKEMLTKPAPEKVTLPAANSAQLSRAEVYEQARRSRVRVGWYYLCHKCNHWHTRLAGGYPLTDDGVIATCHHVATPEDDVREGYLIVVDGEGVVTPVTNVIAASAGMDSCLLRTSGGKFHPLPLNESVRPGDAVYCLSDPLGLSGYFSEGMVNRFFRKSGGSGDEALRLNVRTHWAPGSSGSPVLDQCGNAVGHVSMITTMSGDEKERSRRSGTQIVLHEASTAHAVIALLRTAAGAVEKSAAEQAAGEKPVAEAERAQE